MRVTISKYEEYPSEAPIGVAVGFRVFENERAFYKDIVLEYGEIEGQTEERILALAWDKLEPEINAELERIKSLPPLVGSNWSSTTNEIIPIGGNEVIPDPIDEGGVE